MLTIIVAAYFYGVLKQHLRVKREHLPNPVSTLINALAQESPERREFVPRILAYHLRKANAATKIYRLVDKPWRDAHYEFADGASSFAEPSFTSFFGQCQIATRNLTQEEGAQDKTDLAPTAALNRGSGKNRCRKWCVSPSG